LADAAMASLPALLAYATKAMFGYDDDDEDTLRAGLADYQRMPRSSFAQGQERQSKIFGHLLR
jgi:hypothetical protein